MAFITMTARKASVCKRCGQTIQPGETIRWSRYGGSYHLAKHCPTATTMAGTAGSDANHAGQVEYAPGEYITAEAAARYGASQKRYAPRTTSHGPDIDRITEDAYADITRDYGSNY